MTPAILAIAGPKDSGKSTLAQLLSQRYGYERVAFADGIKVMLLALYEYQGLRNGRARRMLWGDLKEEPTPLLNERTSRWAMQTLGTEWGRKLIHPDLWLDIWTRHIKNKSLVVAEDMRFPNEAQRVHDLGGKIITVTRPGTEFNGHLSEMEYLRITPDLTILNNARPEDMLEQLTKGYESTTHHE
jgi:hypothetical protein